MKYILKEVNLRCFLEFSRQLKDFEMKKKKKKKKKNSTSNPQDTENVLNAKMRLLKNKISVSLISEVSHKKMN